MITEMEKLKKYQLIEQADLIYLKTSIKIGHKEKLMVRIKSGLKSRWVSEGEEMEKFQEIKNL